MPPTRRLDRPATRAVTSEILDRQPPANVEAEQCVLGSILLLPDACDEVAMILRADDFYDDANQRLFIHFMEMHDEGKRIDVTILVDRLKTAGDYEAVGGAPYLAKIGNAVPHAAHAVYYANIVREKATLRAMINASTEILRDAYDETDNPNDLLSRAEHKIFDILDSRGKASITDIAEILNEALDRIDARMKGEHTTGGVESGFADLDNLTGGMHNGELIILAARPAMGKTALAMNVAENVAIHQKAPTLFVSLEMSSIELADRLLCSMARVNGHRLRNGTISNEDRGRLVDMAAEIHDSPLFVDDSPHRTVTEIAAAARRVRRRHNDRLGLIVIDYLQLIHPDNQNDPRQEQVAKIARRLKGLARELKVPIFCLAQLNRQTEASKDNRPRLSHLRESGAIEQDADVVMFVHREEYYLRGDAADEVAGQAEIIVAKQRNGPVDDIELIWQKDFTRFEDRAADRFNEFDDYNENATSF